MTLEGRHIVLGVSGGIASYKSCTVARRLTQMGAAVDVVLTDAAAEFVGPVTFEALTGRPVMGSIWDRGRALDHIDLARDPDLVIIAPATANLIARAAGGMASDGLTAILLARSGPVVLAPAMNDSMYAHPATQANLGILRERGWEVIGPATGELAEGPSNRPGRMSEPEEIVVRAERLVTGSKMRGKRVVVTAGPTREPIDDVRVVTNRSSGLMGYQLAARAYAHGADTTLIAGPGSLPDPWGVEVLRVETTREMEDAVRSALKEASVLIMAAAPADYRPASPVKGKMPRSGGELSIELEPTEDILQATSNARPERLFCVGFALESGDGKARAREKLQKKSLDMIIYNRADEDGAGFEVDTNRVTIMTAAGEEDVPLASKAVIAERIIAAVESRLND